MSREELQQFVDRFGSIDRAARFSGMPRDDWRELCRINGVRASRPKGQTLPPSDGELAHLLAYRERTERFLDDLSEMFGHIVFPPNPLHDVISKRGHELGLDTATFTKLADEAVHVARATFHAEVYKLYKLAHDFEYGDVDAEAA